MRAPETSTNSAPGRRRIPNFFSDDRRSSGTGETVSDLDPRREKSVIVVGGGVAGMSAACALAEAGLRVQWMRSTAPMRR